jgi:hypothetical protein
LPKQLCKDTTSFGITGRNDEKNGDFAEKSQKVLVDWQIIPTFAAELNLLTNLLIKT